MTTDERTDVAFQILDLLDARDTTPADVQVISVAMTVFVYHKMGAKEVRPLPITDDSALSALDLLCKWAAQSHTKGGTNP